jgi:hypothetical protein
LLPYLAREPLRTPGLAVAPQLVGDGDGESKSALAGVGFGLGHLQAAPPPLCAVGASLSCPTVCLRLAVCAPMCDLSPGPGLTTCFLRSKHGRARAAPEMSRRD